MIISTENYPKKPAYKSSLGADLLQFGTNLDFWGGKRTLKIASKNNGLEHDFGSNPEWGFQNGNFGPHSEKNAYFSISYITISDCKISPIPTVYKASLETCFISVCATVCQASW